MTAAFPKTTSIIPTERGQADKVFQAAFKFYSR
jgi:hypothetical protein